MKNLNLNYQVDIAEQGFINGDFIIQGTAINSVVTSNNHKFLSEELEKSAQTLRGVPLLIDHENTVSSIKGRVLSGSFNEMEEKVDFRAKVMDDEIKELIKDGRLNTVSVGAIVEDIEEEDGLFIPRGITFKELSLVAVPADSGATFQIALKEAYGQSKLDLQLINTKEVKMSEEDAKVETPEEEESKPEVEEPKEEPEVVEPEVEAEPEPEPAVEPVTEEKVKNWVKQAIKEADEDEKKAEPEEEAEAEEEPEEETKEGYKIEQSSGSIKGGAFTLVR